MKNKKCLIALIPFLMIIFLFELAPLASIIVQSFSPVDDIGFTLEHFIKILTTDLYIDSIKGSLIIAFVSSVLGIVISFFGAKAAHSNKKTGKIFRTILNITSNFAGIPLAFAFIILLGNTGVITLFVRDLGFDLLKVFDLYSINGLILTYVYFQIPLATLLLLPSFHLIKKEWEEAVQLLGGTKFTYWFKVAIPNLLPSILGTFSVLFANAIAAYATGYALLSSNAMLLPIRISEQFVGDLVQAKEFGSALAVILMLLMVLATLILNKIQKQDKGGSCS